MSRSQQAHDAAAMWVVRRDRGDWSDDDQVEFDRWLAESDGNKAAFWRLNHSWREADRVRSLGLKSSEAVRSERARFLKPVAIAASLALMVGIGVVGYVDLRTPPQAIAARYATAIGGHRIVPLADGSTVELNTRTVVRAAVTGAVRDVWLDRGEAFFEVAHDAAHPFVVHAGPKRITVLGTKFVVRRNGKKVSVAVVEGRVRIDDAAAPPGNATSSSTITGGALAISNGPSTLVTVKSENRVENELAWRDGMLKFEQAPLSRVAAEFNRYNRRQIVITDSKAAGIEIGGTFKVTNIDAFTRLLRDAYGLKIVSEPDDIKISG